MRRIVLLTAAHTMTTTTVMKNSMSMTNAAETAGFTTVQNAAAPTDLRDCVKPATGAWTGKASVRALAVMGEVAADERIRRRE